MKKIIVAFLLGAFSCQTMVLATTLDNEKAILKETLTTRFQHDNIKSIRDSYEKELTLLETQYQRNKQIDDFQKRQKPDVIQTSVYTTPFKFISSQEWDDAVIKYANDISITKVTRRNSTELIFHFPVLPLNIKSKLNDYHINMPTFKIVSVLLSSGKSVILDQPISYSSDDQTIIIDTDDATVLKVNLSMNYQVPSVTDSITILDQQRHTQNGMSLLPAFNNIAAIQLDQDKIDSIIHIDAKDSKGNTISAKSAMKITNPNELSTQSIKLEFLKNLITAIDNQELKTPKAIIDYALEHSDSYISSSINPTRNLSKSFSGNIEQVIIYSIDTPINKQYDFSVY